MKDNKYKIWIMFHCYVDILNIFFTWGAFEGVAINNVQWNLKFLLYSSEIGNTKQLINFRYFQLKTQQQHQLNNNVKKLYISVRGN